MKTSTPAENHQYDYAAVIPCYNEEERLPYHSFIQFARQNPGALLCFVNDGSTDGTLSLLRALACEGGANVMVLDLKKNGGKAEAVRQGMLHIYRHYQVNLLGYLDADLATTLEEYASMVKYKNEHEKFSAIVGSRIQRLGAAILRKDNRSLFSSVIKAFIRIILKTPFQDTQCGAKIFQRHLIPFLFSQPFITPWLFDVEIFLRLQKKFGRSSLSSGVLEFPLMQWTEVGNSKLKMKHALRIPLHLVQLQYKYNISGRFRNKNGYSIFENLQTRNSIPGKVSAALSFFF